jgi:hypothetical protein
LTQIPFDAGIIAETGFAKTYQLLLHFEKTRRDYSSKEILDLTASQFQQLNMELGEILEPIAPLCSAKGTKPWNGMTKVHLRNPTSDGNALLTGTRVFSLILDEELTIPKISKRYDSLASNDLLTVTISSPNLSQMPPHEILTEIVTSSFCRGQEYEISQVHKQKEDAKAYLVGTSPEQCKKLVLHQVIVNHEILQSRTASEESFTKKEIQKKNCLTLIVKNCNVAYSASDITESLRQIIGTKNIIQTYFPRGDIARDLHAGVCNLEVINPIVYKQYVKKNLKLLHMHARCTPHPRSLDGTNCPDKQTLKDFGFTDVNTAIVNTMTAISNQPAANNSQNVTMAQVVYLLDKRTETVKKELKQNIQSLKNDVVAEAHTYTDLVTKDLRDKLDAKFEEMMGFLSSTRKLLKNGTSPRLTNTQQEN